jgi:hypothetical protein
MAAIPITFGPLTGMGITLTTLLLAAAAIAQLAGRHFLKEAQVSLVRISNPPGTNLASRGARSSAEQDRLR